MKDFDTEENTILSKIRLPRFRLFEIAVILVAIVIFFSSYVTVGPGQRGVLMTFGAVRDGVLMPGFHFKAPFIQQVKMIDVQIQKSEATETAASRDLQNVTTQVAVNWSIQPSDAEWVYQQLGDEDELTQKVIEPIVSNSVKAVTAKYDAEDLVEKRDLICDQIRAQVIEALAAYKVKVEGVNITNFAFSPEYSQAIESKQVAQQNSQKAQYDLVRIKVEAQQAVAQAQGQAQAQKLIQSSLTPGLIQLKAVEKWHGVLPLVVGGNGVIPMIGSINSEAGIKPTGTTPGQ